MKTIKADTLDELLMKNPAYLICAPGTLISVTYAVKANNKSYEFLGTKWIAMKGEQAMVIDVKQSRNALKNGCTVQMADIWKRRQLAG